MSCLQLLGTLPREIFPWPNHIFRAKIFKSSGWLGSSKEFIPHQLNQLNHWHVHCEPTTTPLNSALALGALPKLYHFAPLTC